MSTFYDNKNRPHTLKEIDKCFTYLHSLEDNSEVKISNLFFSTIFKETRNERKIPRNAGWPLGEVA